MLKTIQPKIETELITITPDIAVAWLEVNKNNRTPSDAAIRKLARDMANGNWRFTGDPIRFDNNGRLIDGQHRLMACRRSGVPFKSIVIYGLDPLAQDVIDTGKSRKIADVLSLRGIHNAKIVGSTLRRLVLFRDGLASKGEVASTSDLIDALERHPNITKSCVLVTGGSFPRAMPRSAIAVVHYLATHYLKQPDAADKMINVIRTGVPSYHGDIIHSWRERLLRSDAEKVQSEVAINTLYYAWNLFAAEKTVGVLRWQKEFVEINGIDRSQL